MMKIMKSQIFKNKPDIKVYSKKDPSQELSITSVNLDTEGHIVLVNTEDGQTIYSEDAEIYQNFLEVPGVGYLRPGTKVKLQSDSSTYLLLFGWHTNISNQTIYSWYLRPLTEVVDKSDRDYMSHYQRPLSQDRTVYRDMIDSIWKVTA